MPSQFNMHGHHQMPPPSPLQVIKNYITSNTYAPPSFLTTRNSTLIEDIDEIDLNDRRLLIHGVSAFLN
jgi:hypothetical protein